MPLDQLVLRHQVCHASSFHCLDFAVDLSAILQGESRPESILGAIMRPQSPEKGGEDGKEEGKGFPDIDKYRLATGLI